MSQESFEQFRQAVFRDAALQRRLRETKDKDSLYSLTLQLGAERGHTFDAGDLENALREGWLAWLNRWI